MGKLRSDSTWKKLTPEEREKLECWLFEERASYQEVLERVKREFQVEASLTSLAMYYQRVAKERKELDIKNTVNYAKRINNLGDSNESAGASLDDLRYAGMKLAALRLVQVATESPEKVKELTALARVIGKSYDTDLLIHRIELMREKWEWDASTACAMHKIELDKIESEKNVDEAVTLRKCREALFGPNLPD
jgi:hypothetical protein